MPTASAATVNIFRDNHTYNVNLPTCLQYGDILNVASGQTVHIETATESGDINGRYPLKDPNERGPGTFWAYFPTLFRGFTAPPQTMALYAASRSGAACPPGPAATTPLAAVERLQATDQQIGADLRAIVAMWQPSAASRLVRAKLVRPDGSVLAQNATCRGASLALLLRAGDLHEGDHLTLQITDNKGGALYYDIAVIAPEALPQPPAAGGEEWLVATWRLAAAGKDTALDSITRVAKASDTSYGAQTVLGAVATNTPF